MEKVTLAVTLLSLSISVFAANENSKDALYEITQKVAYNYCFLVINKTPARQSALNQLKISPSSACHCASTETANAMEANNLYHAFLRNQIRNADIREGKAPTYAYEKDQDAAVDEFTKIFNNSWENCVMRLK